MQKEASLMNAKINEMSSDEGMEEKKKGELDEVDR